MGFSHRQKSGREQKLRNARSDRAFLYGVIVLLLVGYGWVCLANDIFVLPRGKHGAIRDMRGLPCLIMVSGMGTVALSFVLRIIHPYLKERYRDFCDTASWFLLYTAVVLACGALVLNSLTLPRPRRGPSPTEFKYAPR